MPDYNDQVFINCPFDDDYKLLFRSIVFTIYCCGFFPRCASEEDNGLDIRLSKILRIIGECRYGIHDISRTESNKDGYPRFNMPFELGLFYSCKHFSKAHKNKSAVIFENVKYSYQKTISDLNGVDTKEHKNDYKELITKTVNWLSTSSRRKSIPGFQKIIEQFNQFEIDLPVIISKSGLSLKGMTFNDLCAIMEDWISIGL